MSKWLVGREGRSGWALEMVETFVSEIDARVYADMLTQITGVAHRALGIG